MYRFGDFLHYPLLRIGGGDLTPGSLGLVVALLALSAAAAHLSGRGAERLLGGRGLSEGARFAAAKIVRYVVFLIGVFVSASSLGLDLTAALAASTVLLVGIGFGLQNIAQNFISGLIVLFEQPVRKGDFIRVGDAYGFVDNIGLRATSVITRDQVTIIVPNSELVSSQVVNHSKPTTNLRTRVDVGVAYGSNTARVREILLEVARNGKGALAQPPPEVRLENFGDSSLDFSLFVWIANPGDDLRVTSELRFAIDEAFRVASIEIPFPQRVVWTRASGSETSPKTVRTGTS